jgi:hypothetical protein
MCLKASVMSTILKTLPSRTYQILCKKPFAQVKAHSRSCKERLGIDAWPCKSNKIASLLAEYVVHLRFWISRAFPTLRVMFGHRVVNQMVKPCVLHSRVLKLYFCRIQNSFCPSQSEQMGSIMKILRGGMGPAS